MRTRVSARTQLLCSFALVLVSLGLLVVGAAPLAHALPSDFGPTTPLLDDFNRTDESPLRTNGGKWSSTGIDGGLLPRLVNTQLQTSGSRTKGSAYRVEAQTGDMEVHVTFASAPQNLNGAVIFVNLQQVGTAGWDGYGLRLYKQIGGYVWNLYQYENGAPKASLGSWGGGPASGDRAMLRREGGQLQAWYYTAATGTWEQKLPPANAANFGNYIDGHIGVQIIDNGYGGPPILDDFGGTESFGPEPPSVPATPVLDHFNRVPEDPLSQSGNWAPTDPGGSATGTLEVNGVLGRNQDSGGVLRSYRATDYSGDVEAIFTIAAMPGTGDSLELLLNLQDVGTASWDGYRVRLVDGATDQFYIDRVADGTPQTLGGPSPSLTVLAGERLLARQVFSEIQVWRERADGSWQLELSAVDPAPYTSGKIGAGIGDKSGAIEDFGGGAVVSDATLLVRYAPELRYFHDETYSADRAEVGVDLFLDDPEPHGVVLKHATLDPIDEQIIADNDASTGPSELSLNSLNTNGQPGWFFLDQPDIYGDAIASAAQDYNTWISEGDRHYAYSRAVVDPSNGDVYLQYWMFYYFNPKEQDPSGVGEHEGDWEWVQLRVNAMGAPLDVALSQHGGGEKCSWGPEVELSPTGNPAVYVAQGSHANYFWPGDHDVGLGFTDYTDEGGIHQVPTIIDVTLDSLYPWLLWDGKWGASGGFMQGNSPKSPGQQAPWDAPWEWHAGAGGCTSPMLLRTTTRGSRTADLALRETRQLHVQAQAPKLPSVLRARLVTGTKFGRAVRVSYCFNSLPANQWTRPWRLHLTLDNVRDKELPLSIPWKVEKRCGTIVHPVGGIKPPYTLRYFVESRRGTRSREARKSVS